MRHTQTNQPFGELLLLCLVCSFTPNQAFGYNDAFDNEPPLLKDLLTRASVSLEKDNLETSWQALGMYCEAACYGSSEAVYRLGMLYAFGQGVPARRDYAANLFGMVARNGYFKAQK
jgi:TPR repeat protein